MTNIMAFWLGVMAAVSAVSVLVLIYCCVVSGTAGETEEREGLKVERWGDVGIEERLEKTRRK